jgi:hypothetical protein
MAVLFRVALPCKRFVENLILQKSGIGGLSRPALVFEARVRTRVSDCFLAALKHGRPPRSAHRLAKRAQQPESKEVVRRVSVEGWNGD